MTFNHLGGVSHKQAHVADDEIMSDTKLMMSDKCNIQLSVMDRGELESNKLQIGNDIPLHHCSCGASDINTRHLDSRR